MQSKWWMKFDDDILCSYSSMSLSTRDDRMPLFPVHGYLFANHKSEYRLISTYSRLCELNCRHNLPVRARLTRSHISNARFVPQIAHFWIITSLWSVWIVTMEWLEWVHAWQWRWIAHPLQGLPIRYNPHVVHGVYCVEEFDETFFVMWLRKPGGMIEQSKWSSESTNADVFNTSFPTKCSIISYLFVV